MNRNPETVSPLVAGVLCRCPRCGRAPLYDGLLTIRERCAECGLDLRAQDSGDGPAVFVILVLGFIVVGLAALVEVKLGPPLWVHAVLWPGIILAGAVYMLRILKAGLIALQFRHRAAGTDVL
ncbi:MAG: DUF983 domain-containing protein [Alphaproteobacteria bacterium]|nr:DUF983 domain-containing protein [Alphaproteobacteria bacterium]